MTVLQFLKDFPYLPMILGKDGRYERPSNSLIKNWVSQRVVLINGTSELRADDELQFPLEQFIIFPKKKAQRRTYEDYSYPDVRSPRYWDIQNELRDIFATGYTTI